VRSGMPREASVEVPLGRGVPGGRSSEMIWEGGVLTGGVFITTTGTNCSSQDSMKFCENRVGQGEYIAPSPIARTDSRRRRRGPADGSARADHPVGGVNSRILGDAQHAIENRVRDLTRRHDRSGAEIGKEVRASLRHDGSVNPHPSGKRSLARGPR
jgi:hypothetical protein